MALSYETIVIGLGAAGATAASTLAKAGKRVLALEAQNRVGGRVCTVPFADGVIELGAEWIHGDQQSRPYDLAMEKKISILPQDNTLEVFYSDGSVKHSELVEELFAYIFEQFENPTVDAPVGEYLTEKIKEYIKAKYPELLNDDDSINGFLNLADLVMSAYTASDTWNDLTTKSEGKPLEGHQKLSWHEHGYETLFQLIFNTYNNGPGYENLDILLNTEVVNIKYSQDPSDSVVVTTKDGAVYKANNVIVTLSVGVLKERHSTLFTPPLPQEKVDCIDRTSIGVINKIILSFDEAWWPETAVSFAFVWRGEEISKLSKEDQWMTNIWGASRPLAANKALTLWTRGEAAKLMETLPEDVVKSKVMQLLRMFMGAGKTIPEPTGIIRSTWYSNSFTRGSYSYDNLLMPQFPNTREDLGQPLTDALGKPQVLFAGEATDRTHFSTVHGASDTGYREAMRLLNSKK